MMAVSLEQNGAAIVECNTHQEIRCKDENVGIVEGNESQNDVLHGHV